eukprot:CAMPEP_0179141490 /NCGR_PEP_ID=MMETSP0796-20121207/67864_1 /TAXON_ID=73915 /ORGANISM="Pyrodinium bahamense, Strain pbaha01" /LENGTH=96 /DNA_ID=CAMNT_0020841217 /DNA_START=344 /DNA_END=634 /DNA_ORIENTATION=-
MAFRQVAKTGVAGHPQFFERAIDKFFDLVNYQPRHLVAIAWACAWSHLRHAPLLASIASQARRLRREFTAAGLSKIAWAVAKLGFTDNPLRHAIAS